MAANDFTFYLEGPHGERELRFRVVPDASGSPRFELLTADRRIVVDPSPDGRFLLVNGVPHAIHLPRDGVTGRIHVNGHTFRHETIRGAAGMARGRKKKAEVREVKAPLSGKVIAVRVAPGAAVTQGDVLLVIEAMKMENEIRAPRAGVVADVLVAPADTVGSGDPLLRFA